MKLCVFTIVLDGMPWIAKHLPIFLKLKCYWQWIVIEGAAMNTADTSWCKPQEPRISNDGTHEYLMTIKDRRVVHAWDDSWKNKTAMVNTALLFIKEPCVLMEIDSDEIWRLEQLEKIVELFSDFPSLSSIMFPCRYYVGKDLVLQGNKCYGDYDYEWLRAWRFLPGMTFKSHEPVVLRGDCGQRLGKNDSRNLGLTFDHYAYATEASVRYKEKFYGYDGLMDGWRRLQEVKEFPVKLSDYFPQVKGDLPLVIRENGTATA